MPGGSPVFARYAFYVDHEQRAAFLWTPARGIVHANARGRVWTTDLIQGELLGAAAALCVQNHRAEVIPVAEGAFLLVPLLEGRNYTKFVIGLEGLALNDVPRILHEVYETPRHFSNVVHALPQIVMTAQPNGDFDYTSNKWYKASGCRLGEWDVGEMLRRKLCDAETFFARWRAGIETGRPFEFEFQLSTVEGVRWYALRAVPSHDKAYLHKWIVSLDDVDEFVHSREAVAAAGRRMKALADIGTLALDRNLHEEELLHKALVCASQALEALWLASYTLDGESKTVAHQHEARFFARVFAETPAVSAPNLSLLKWNGDEARPVLRVPFRLAGEVQPGFAIIGQPGAALFDELDIHLAREVAWRIENALALRREAHVASVLQTALLPVALPQPDGLSFDVAYRSADIEALVGGDWYDAFPLSDGRIAFSIGDVGGHGLNAAFVMGHVREMVRTGAKRGLAPHEVFAAANEAVIASAYGLISAVLGYIDPLTLDMQYAVAGHPAPLLVTHEGEVEAIYGGDEILGATPAAAYHLNELTLVESGALVLYTDGAVEHSHDIEAGEAQLSAALAAWGAGGFEAPALELLTRLLAGKPVRDDAALLVVRTQPLTRVNETLPAVPASSRRIRRGARRGLRHSELGTRAEEFVLAICEAVNNAIEHGSPFSNDCVRVVVDWDDDVAHATIESTGPWHQSTPKLERGRGLMLMRAFCDRVDVDVRDGGTIVDLYMHVGTHELTARSGDL